MTSSANIQSRRCVLLVVGDVMLDRWIEAEARPRPAAGAPVLRTTSETVSPGGAANAAAHAAGSGADVLLVGLVGEDSAGLELERALVARGLAPGRLVRSARPTTVKTRIREARRTRLRLDVETDAPADTELEARLLSAALSAAAQADAILISDYAKGAVPARLARALINRAAAGGKPVVVDSRAPDWSGFHGATAITPSRSDLELGCGAPLTDEAALDAEAARMGDRLGAAVIVTLEDKGARLFQPGRLPLALASASGVPGDREGAGDAFAAALALALGQGFDLPVAARAASDTASEVAACAEGEPEAELRGPMSRADLADLTADWRARGLTIGFTNGCFDLLHEGHVALLAAAAGACDRLIVGLNSDASVRRLKGPGRPVRPEGARAAVLSAVRGVAAVCFFEEDTPKSLIAALAPDVLVKGGDYRLEDVVGADLVRERGGRVILAPLVGEVSTSAIVRAVETGGPGKTGAQGPSGRRTGAADTRAG